MKYFKLIPLIFFFILTSISNNYAGNSDCLIAKDLSGRAYETIKTDVKKSLVLFIQAENLCEEPEYDYNLSIAYWKYGSPEKAIISMIDAVNKKKNPMWLNNLAMMLMQSGKDPSKALEYSKNAFYLNSENPAIADTLVKANLYSDNNLEALKLAIKFSNKWKNNERIQSSRDYVADKYLTKYLLDIKNKNYSKGLRGLSNAADLIPGAAKGLAFVLSDLGKFEAAVDVVKKAETDFPDSPEITGLFDKVLKKTITKLYKKFQSGEEKEALSMAKELSFKYPEIELAKNTYDKLFDAFLNSVAISSPDLVKSVKKEKINNDSDALMASFFNEKESTGLELIPDIEKNIPENNIKNPQGIAVIIGNRRYEKYNKGIKDVLFAERDAAIMKKYLVKTLGYQEENIIYYLNTTSGDLRDIFGTRFNSKGKLSRFIRDNESDVFIYYSGHGAPGPKGESAYFVPVDASPDFIENNGYPLDLFYEQIEKLPAKSVTIVLESCFSGDSAAGVLFKNLSPAMLKNISAVKNIKNVTVFCSADKNQVATWYPEKRHGLFTYFFLKGISGKADSNKDNNITLKEMTKYLNYEVPHWAGRKSNRTQTPVVRGQMDKILINLKN